jgi:F-type H+-transporting ATPase subunit c
MTGMIGAGIGVGNIFGSFLTGALRNPSAAGSQIGNLFVGAALAEALGILAFVIGILIWISVIDCFGGAAPAPPRCRAFPDLSPRR